MLSRIAESLYWIGRYVERAEDTARILDVHMHRLLDDPSTDEEASGRLLAVMGASLAAPTPDATAVTEVLAFDATAPSSIVAALRAARENARGARDALSSELWQCLNSTHNELPARMAAARAASPHAFFEFVKERCAQVAGLTDSTMSRDDGWRFLVLGRSLERVDMTARMLSTRLMAPSTPAEWVSTLQCCSAHEAFLRTYRRALEPPLVVEFLVLDRLFPRSAFHALSSAEACLADLDPAATRTGLPDEARRIVGRARTDLEFCRIEDLMADLRQHLYRLQLAVSRGGDAIGRRFFRELAPQAWAEGLNVGT